jgi:hypothetical protein
MNGGIQGGVGPLGIGTITPVGTSNIITPININQQPSQSISLTPSQLAVMNGGIQGGVGPLGIGTITPVGSSVSNIITAVPSVSKPSPSITKVPIIVTKLPTPAIKPVSGALPIKAKFYSRW